MRSVAVLALFTACALESPTDQVGESTSSATVAAIPRGSVWKYWDRGGDLGTAWRLRGYADASWASGPGPLGYGESYLETPVSWGSSSTSRHITTYFRGRFEVADPAAVTGLRGEVMYDDGVVVYLNGVEIERNAMPSGTVTATTLSTGHEANNSYRTHDWSAHRGLLVAGTNVIAVEVHQASPSSSDLVFDLSLTMDAEQPVINIGGVARRSLWYYWDQGGDLGTAWRSGDLGDRPWTIDDGAFGYGEDYLGTTISYGSDPANKHITSYFVTPFNLDNPTAVTGMTGEVMYDDGVVVYLNGVEVARRSMPSGTITASTLSTGHEAGNAYLTIDLSAHLNLLRYGGNFLAAEVHQASASSSDLVFDMALSLNGPAAPPPSPEEDIARGSVWRYWDRASAPSEWDLWAQPDFNDGVWKSGPGPLGYGESYHQTTLSYGSDPSNKPVTAYFRRWFTVDDPTVDTQLIMELIYDDGAVIHLNGHEVFRLGMPRDVDITHGTLAFGHESGLDYEGYSFDHAAQYLVPGPNLLAVEIHQASRSSSDLTFDLELEVNVPATCAIPYCGPAQAPAPGVALNAVWTGIDGIWVVGDDGTIGHKAPSGPTFCWCQRDASIDYQAIWGDEQGEVWIVGTGGRVVHHGGAVFDEHDVGTTARLNGVWGSGPDDVWVVGQGGTVRRLDLDSWSAHDLPADQDLRAVWAASAADVWIGGREPAPYPDNPDYDGSSGVIYRWNAATSTWTLVHKHTMYNGFADISAIHGTGPADIWAVGAEHPSGAAISYSTALHWDGSAWSGTENVAEGRFSDVFAAGNQVWITSTAWDAPGWHLDGTTWTQVRFATRMTGVHGRGGDVWAVGYDNRIFKWAGDFWVSYR